MKVICPVCQRNGEKSRCHSLGCMTTDMGDDSFYDESGEYHNHDPNKQCFSLRCSRGHWFSVITEPKCPAPGCDYGGSVKFREDER